MRKSRFFTLICSFMPGAAQMYLGLMRRGVSLMGAFFLFWFLGIWLRVEILFLPLPIIWFYSFFDALNLRSMPYERLIRFEDRYLFHMDQLAGRDWWGFIQKRHKFLGGVCVFLGFYLLLNNFVYPVFRSLFHNFYGFERIIRGIPTFIVAVLVILLGLYLLRNDLSRRIGYDDDFKHYGDDSTYPPYTPEPEPEPRPQYHAKRQARQSYGPWQGTPQYQTSSEAFGGPVPHAPDIPKAVQEEKPVEKPVPPVPPVQPEPDIHLTLDPQDAGNVPEAVEEDNREDESKHDGL